MDFVSKIPPAFHDNAENFERRQLENFTDGLSLRSSPVQAPETSAENTRCDESKAVRHVFLDPRSKKPSCHKTRRNEKTKCRLNFAADDSETLKIPPRSHGHSFRNTNTSQVPLLVTANYASESPQFHQTLHS